MPRPFPPAAAGRVLVGRMIREHMQAVARLDRHRYLSLATYRRTGAEVRTPVWFAAIGDTLVVVSAGDAGKVKRLRRSSRARVAPCDVRGSLEGPWRDATARLVTDPDTIAHAHAALRAKYGRRMWMLDLISRLAGRINRRAWIEIEIAA
jgi:PPOX class probable F420-dependent enzyme